MKERFERNFYFGKTKILQEIFDFDDNNNKIHHIKRL